MLLRDEGVQTGEEMGKKQLEEKIVKEGLELLKKQKEETRRRKVKEQQEMKEMLERYWPWERAADAKPRGLKNLRLEELFPNKDYQNAKRAVDMGSWGGGAPIIRDGQKITKTKEDPFLRFQLGSKDLKKAVENGFRYKTNRKEQMEYKNELDKLVEEKKQKQLRQKLKDAEYETRQGWSNEDTLKKLEQKAITQKENDKRNYENFKKLKVAPPNRMVKPDQVLTPPKKNFSMPGRNRRLSPLSNDKENGLELVDLLAKDRRTPRRVPLCSTDVTKEKEVGKSYVFNRQSSAYLKDLTDQMLNKQQKIQELKAMEAETSKRHFSTWESFWGKPGHGAPRSATKKTSISRLLYPQLQPIGVS